MKSGGKIESVGGGKRGTANGGETRYKTHAWVRKMEHLPRARAVHSAYSCVDDRNLMGKIVKGMAASAMRAPPFNHPRVRPSLLFIRIRINKLSNCSDKSTITIIHSPRNLLDFCSANFATHTRRVCRYREVYVCVQWNYLMREWIVHSVCLSVVSVFSFSNKIRKKHWGRSNAIYSQCCINFRFDWSRALTKRETERGGDKKNNNNIRLARCVATTVTNFVQSGYGIGDGPHPWTSSVFSKRIKYQKLAGLPFHRLNFHNFSKHICSLLRYARWLPIFAVKEDCSRTE